jgi:hypothetical protein
MKYTFWLDRKTLFGKNQHIEQEFTLEEIIPFAAEAWAIKAAEECHINSGYNYFWSCDPKEGETHG